MLRKMDEGSLQEALEALAPFIVRNLSSEESKDLRQVIQTWRSNFIRRFKANKCSGILKRFLAVEAVWLGTEVPIPARFLKPAPTGESARAKRRRVCHVSSGQKEEPDILLLGTAKTIAKVGTPRSAARAKLLRQMAKDKEKAATVLTMSTKWFKKQRSLSAREGLQSLLELDLTKAKYNTLRKISRAAGHNLFPSYNRVVEAKKECRPPANAIQANEKGANVKLSSLLEHTCRRVVQHRRAEIVANFHADQTLTKEATMIFSWGMDGAGNQAKYKQRGEKPGFVQESHLFVISVVPLQLGNENDVYWQNPKPQSPLFCRPLKILFEKEDKALVLQERESVLQEIMKLRPLRIIIDETLT